MRLTLTLAALALTLPAQAREVTISHYSGRRGALLANGHRYTDNRTLFASRSYPLGTRLRVTLGGRSVEGLVEDRTARQFRARLDLNEHARRRLGFHGLARATVEVMRRDRHPP